MYLKVQRKGSKHTVRDKEIKNLGMRKFLQESLKTKRSELDHSRFIVFNVRSFHHILKEPQWQRCTEVLGSHDRRNSFVAAKPLHLCGALFLNHNPGPVLPLPPGYPPRVLVNVQLCGCKAPPSSVPGSLTYLFLQGWQHLPRNAWL